MGRRLHRTALVYHDQIKSLLPRQCRTPLEIKSTGAKVKSCSGLLPMVNKSQARIVLKTMLEEQIPWEDLYRALCKREDLLQRPQIRRHLQYPSCHQYRHNRSNTLAPLEPQQPAILIHTHAQALPPGIRMTPPSILHRLATKTCLLRRRRLLRIRPWGWQISGQGPIPDFPMGQPVQIRFKSLKPNLRTATTSLLGLSIPSTGVSGPCSSRV